MRAPTAVPAPLLVRIDAVDLPGRTFTHHAPHPSDGGPARLENVHVAVQRRDRPAELLGLHPGDAPSASWTLECTVTSTGTGPDVTGRYVQGRPGDRFVYLSWGALDARGTFTMFRRAKLLLAAVPAAVLDEAARGGLLVGRLGLTDEHGGPRCARVVPPAVRWSAYDGRTGEELRSGDRN
ncbi:DUF5990 family protein [Streptomyces sp. NPDC008150]|uniref:DUF5990 family protein n=1 Tax=Streptomyces sp. NPDC008150 TaxID=3364816 RepID=UPI0036EC6C82